MRDILYHTYFTMETKFGKNSSYLKMYMFIQCVLCLCFITSECRINYSNQIDNRLKILEQKFAIQAYENSLMRGEFMDMSDRLLEIETAADTIDQQIEKRINTGEDKDIKHVRTGSEKLPKTTGLMSNLFKAFQAEKLQRQDLERELKQLEESYQLEKEILQSRIRHLESNQQVIEKLIRVQAQSGKRNVNDMSDKLSKLNDSFLSFMDTDILGQVSKLDTKINTFGEMVTANIDVLAKSTEDKLSAVIMNITNLSKRLQTEAHVSFSAKLSSNIQHLAPWAILVFDSVITNIGSAYSGNTGVFTAPANGIYLFYAHVLGTNNRALEMCLQKNGNTVLWMYANGPGHGNDGNMIILQLAKGDNVKVVKHGTWGNKPFYVHNVWTNFAGTLLYSL